ncbi:BREX-2 system adenine-specific DNA-methyltransferase PglX [Streptomyces hygroscopicus]|uniref:BREX-2 system adenine-specific DNA-methyltransferase PglX n=1 Tax=Streptomyces hygroscopicus TaxID=1912 RepID=UPI00076754C2|nr:BREX-2 system adenine-specific DNA-methyltransferase PglX [Streptomyces hygroscopicus]
MTNLRKQVLALEGDLRERSDNVERFRRHLRNAYGQASASSRTSATYGAWRSERITQAAVAWVLGTVFVRFCEDNNLIRQPFLAGPGDRLAEAEERHGAYLTEYPDKNDRDWLLEAFTHLTRSHQAMARIFDLKHSPLGVLSPSPEAAAALVAFWRRRGSDSSIRFDFTDPDLDTRFLGDLYQEISEAARKTYGLIQTPEFIANFVLDLAMDPAIAEFGLERFRGIDPACGAGTFPLGLFQRLLAAWRLAEPDAPDRELILRSLNSVHGCDLNPFAVSITRFRLLIAAGRESGARTLDQFPDHVINVAVGDALLEGPGMPSEPSLSVFGDMEHEGGETRGDVHEFSERCGLLRQGSYHAVLGEPPYISARDKATNAAYRAYYASAAGTFPLSGFFTERMFQLAVRKVATEPCGYVGMYTSSSFTKRAFGEKLIEQFFPRVGLTHVVDTSGVFVPGHRTPTLILAGRNDPGMDDMPVRSVLGVRGEPRQPVDPAQGIVWKAILGQVDRPGTTSEWVSVQDEPRQRFHRFPWTLTGGGGADLMDVLSRAPHQLADFLAAPVGVLTDPGQHEVFALGRPWFTRHPDSAALGHGMVTGDTVRDWRAGVAAEVLAPYDADGGPLPPDLTTSWGRHLWTMRQVLRAAPGSQQSSRARPWWGWRRWPHGGVQRPAITLAYVASHNHFALEAGAEAFSRTAPVLRLPSTADEEEYVALLGVLNSSTACFWLKQVNSSTGFDGLGIPLPGEEWTWSCTFATASFSRFPLPADPPLGHARALHALGRSLASREPSAVCADQRPLDRDALDAARGSHEELRHQMIAHQEELDWEIYGSYGLLSAEDQTRLTMPPGSAPPPLRPGERAFEIVLARKVLAREAANSWFTKNGATPITEIPPHWPTAYRDIVRARIDAIESRPAIALVERPEYKRRWLSEPWERREEKALRSWLLDRCEDERLWFDRRNGAARPRPRTPGQLAQELGDDAGLRSVAALYATDHLGMRDAPLGDVLAAVLTTEHVPCVSALRYKESGLRKRAEWEQVWDLQRSEDRTGEALGIPVPPKFRAIDFRRAAYWSHRGSLDIPRERFISYPEGATEEGGLLLGWSGWNETDRVHVLLDLVSELIRRPGWTVYQLTPLLAGIQELLPWVRQWEAQDAEEFEHRLEDLRTSYGLSRHDVAAWRPRRTT